MNEEFNPYEQQNAPVDPQPYYEQPQYTQPYQQPQYQPYEQQYQQPQYPQNGYYPYYPQQQYAQPQRGGGAAKAFSIVSFVAGCISLVSVLTALASFFVALQTNDISYSSTFSGIYASLVGSSMITAVPGIIFGIIALVRKTKLVPLAIMGIVFNAGYLIISMINNMIVSGV